MQFNCRKKKFENIFCEIFENFEGKCLFYYFVFYQLIHDNLHV